MYFSLVGEVDQEIVDQGYWKNVDHVLGFVKLGERTKKYDMLDFSSSSHRVSHPTALFLDYVTLRGPFVIPNI